jgi:hypothetical protein
VPRVQESALLYPRARSLGLGGTRQEMAMNWMTSARSTTIRKGQRAGHASWPRVALPSCDVDTKSKAGSRPRRHRREYTRRLGHGERLGCGAAVIVSCGAFPDLATLVSHVVRGRVRRISAV